MPSRKIQTLPKDYEKQVPEIASATEGVREAIDRLPHRERRVLEFRFFSGGEKMTYETIGREVGLSGERVRQLLERALKTN